MSHYCLIYKYNCPVSVPLLGSSSTFSEYAVFGAPAQCQSSTMWVLCLGQLDCFRQSTCEIQDVKNSYHCVSINTIDDLMLLLAPVLITTVF